jgi:hypothetical protein
MIAWAWSVYPRLSTNPMVAAGITDKPDRARGEVESVLGADEGAAWGILQQVTVSLGEPSEDHQLSMWPATGYIPVMCRRDGSGGFIWQPVIPVHV